MIHKLEGELYDVEGETAAADDDWCKLLEDAAAEAEEDAAEDTDSDDDDDSEATPWPSDLYFCFYFY